MNQVRINELNKSIGYEAGEIYLNSNNVYTSKLWEELKAQGWEMDCVGDNIDVFDKDGDWVVSEVGILNALKSLAILMR